MQEHIFKSYTPFTLENETTLPYLEIQYNTAGTLNAAKDNVIWVCHALTGNADVFDWWSGLFGYNNFFNPEEHFIVCANVIGSCYGSTGPLQTADTHLHHAFPTITIRDMVAAHELLRVHLGIEHIHTLIGGSLGGQQAIEWALLKPHLMEHLILVATNAKHSAWGIAYNESQRMAIKTDPTWQENHDKAGINGMKVARSIALISYRTYAMYNLSQRESDVNKVDDFKSSSYQRYQGEKLANRFNAFSYMALANAMDSHNVARGRGNLVQALRQIKAKTLAIGVSSDNLFPTTEQQFMASHIPNGQYAEIESDYGHDGFLTEIEELSRIISGFYKKMKTYTDNLCFV